MSEEPVVIAKLYDLILWTLPHLDKFPRNHKFTVGDRIEETLLDILELLIEAAYTKNKVMTLYEANIKLQKFRLMIRMSKDLKLISVKQYQFASRHIEEIGKQIGGWRKQTIQEDEKNQKSLG